MTNIQEIRIAALNGLNIPDNLREGETFTINAELLVSRIDQEWIDVTTVGGKPEQLPGGVTLCTVAKEFKAQ